ncbi:uncharacterized protein LOC127717939 isoform X4 [Mytilus californianus]|uniref:uncharacterized protein LOC127717939 isoform X4 n=1 Tax=Mytilus californianus TaxID=6549 RepID=UPI002247B569|nr:uncharacterized protein LOC127717939 isoform X4 [Mytilus californianus]
MLFYQSKRGYFIYEDKKVGHKMAKLYTHVITFVLCDIIEIVYANVSWTLKPEIIRIGETLSLLCTVDGIDSINGGLIRQWTKGSELICFNGHPINPDKYREIQQNGNQFELKIYNISESDLQCKYQCRYGFDTQTKKLEISEHNFENETTTDKKMLIGLLISLIIVVAVACMVTWIILKRRKSKEQTGNYNVDEKRSCDMTFTSNKLDDDSLCNSIHYGKEMNDDQQKPFLVPDSKS